MYLGLWFDEELTFKEHAKRTAAKTKRIVTNRSRLMSNLRGLSEGKCKLLANTAMLVLLYGAPIWADAINAREYQMVLVQQKTALRCVSAYCTFSIEAVCVLAGIPPIQIVADAHKRVYSATHRINPKSGKALLVRLEERQVTLCKWKEWLSGSSNG